MEEKTKKNKKNIDFLGIFTFILLYSAISYFGKSPSLPSVIKILENSKEIIFSENFYINLLYTLKIVLLGTAISFTLGVSIATFCSINLLARNFIMPIMNMIKNIPSISLFPLFIVLMGIGDAPRIAVIIWNSIYPTISTTIAGYNSVEKEIIEAAQNCGANEIQIFRYIKIPLTIPNMLEGLKISLGNSFIAIVVAEMLGATKGLGYMILWSANTFKYPQMYFYILVVALIGFLINVAIEKLIKKVERKIFYG